jgi:type IV secretory pathway VirD2 relaxase
LDSRDDLPSFRPRIGKRPSNGSEARPRSFRGQLLARLAGASARRPSKGDAAGARAHRADARRVVIKAHVVRLTANGAKAAALHLRYIERDGVDKDGSKGALYGPDGRVQRETFEQPRPDEAHQFRFIVSPEDASELDLMAYVRRLMDRVERDLGRGIEWAAVNHFNTDHPHAHVVVRGVGRDGHELRFDRSYIATGMRWRAQELATEELGPRREHEIQRVRGKEVSQERFTSLDRELERLADSDGSLKLQSPRRPGSADRSTLLARLEHLETMGLAETRSRSEWVLAAGWQSELRELGKRGDILKQIHDAVRGDASRYRIVGPGEPLPQREERGEKLLVGRVAAKGLSDEVKGGLYAVLETPSGEAFHVALDARQAESLRAGDLVSFGTRREPCVRPIDRHIAEIARRSGGVFAPYTAPADDDETRAVRRLRELERRGLVRSVGPERWATPPDLIQKLERSGIEGPARERLIIQPIRPSLEEQVRHRGPVWLDQVDSSALASFGFGAEVGRALERRRVALRGLGIGPDDPQRLAKLSALEVGAVGREMASRMGQTFLDRLPDRFRGRVQVAPEGAPYVAVSDGARFVLVPASREVGALVGKQVGVTLDARGRPTVQALDKDLGR